jgi:quercetin dioxygenase-like cupin family protein
MSLYFPTVAEMGRHRIFPGVTIQTCACEKMMVSIADLEPGAIVEEHAHEHEQVGIMLAGMVIFTIGDEQRTLVAGDVYRIPGHVRHKVVVLDEPARAIDIFYPVREEYR